MKLTSSNPTKNLPITLLVLIAMPLSVASKVISYRPTHHMEAAVAEPVNFLLSNSTMATKTVAPLIISDRQRHHIAPTSGDGQISKPTLTAAAAASDRSTDLSLNWQADSTSLQELIGRWLEGSSISGGSQGEPSQDNKVKATAVVVTTTARPPSYNQIPKPLLFGLSSTEELPSGFTATLNFEPKFNEKYL